ncbi:restriction endonuclease [Inquilinus sp. OTU3971]|uniref:restriction endonuclease n=1 Tax=Inquilinus sp. OTU3971 TaxID=3043855 RepID=UPI00313B31A8
MAIPDYQTLMLPVLRHAALGETRVPDLEDQIADEFGLTTEERDQLLPSGRQKILHNRIHWAKFYMGKAGLIDSPRRGRFVASEAGRVLLARNPERIDVELLLQYPSFQEFRRSGAAAAGEAGEPPEAALSATEPTASTTPEEQIEAAHLALQAALRDELLQRILQNSPSFFEQVIVDLLVAMGYGGSHRSAATRLGRSGDGGVDGEINEDRLGLDRIYIQAKRYADVTVGRPEVQAFVGSLVGRGATKGVFVTTSSFSQQAKDFVQHLAQRVILIDGQRLADLMIEYNVGVRTSRAIEFKRLDEDFFTGDD